MREYFVIRLCNKADGTVACPVKSFEDEQGAYKEFYRSLAAAVDSENLTDAVVLLTKQGFELDYKVFTHDAPVEEPVEEPIEEGEGE